MTKEQAIEILEKLLYAYSFIDYRFNNMLEVDETNAIQYILSDYERILKENKKKDKQIDLMANHIATSDSDLCEYLDITTKCKYYAGDNGKTCDNCIKQYFENKAKELLNK